MKLPERKTTITSSKNDACIQQLLITIERQYPGVKFECYISNVSTISIIEDDAFRARYDAYEQGHIVSSLRTYCYAYVDGWEAARDAGSSEDYYE